MFLSLLARLGRRQPTAEHDHPDPPPAQTGQQAQPLQIDRKILQDPSSYLDSDAQNALPLALTPSTRLLHSARVNGRSTPSEQAGSLPGASADIATRTQSRFTISRVSRIATGGEWSTFGRKRELRAADAPALSSGRASPADNPNGSPAKDSKHLSAGSTPSTFTLSRITNPSRTSTAHDVPPSPTGSTRSPEQSPDMRSSSKRPSPTDSMSSKWHPRTPQRPSSNTAPASAVNIATCVNREAATDSPHTFGHPTPPDKFQLLPVSCPFPLPPLPPLDHPDLAPARFSCGEPMSTDQLTSSASRDRSNTLPTNRRTIRKDDLFPSLSLQLGRSSVRHQSSLPQTKQAVNDETQRARAVSLSARRRRSSADWNSNQAVVGVTSHANQAWPAEVSREILRLSLLETPGRAGSRQAPGSSERKRSTRGRNTDPNRRSDQAWDQVSPSFLPFPPTSRQNSPPPSLEASATLTDGRETTPSRPHSLHFNLGNRRGSKQAAGAMSEVKHSLSAIEARRSPSNLASGVVHTSLGLGDPAPTSSNAPQASRPSLAPTPSRLPSSSRVSPANTSMSSSLPGEPSTPTPEPRHLTDKSRGKRKAEDNLDLTPPEQKKDGQRATFLLPSESRSQRISNASHAPSSYHRKRARLSATSPFATPVQSRPASVQEAPQSASRDHRFASLSSSTSARIAPTPSRATSTRSRQPPTPSTTRKHERHQSMSQVSIPISAFISPHAPSVSRSTKFHMRDPRKPPRKPNDTPWGLRFTTEDEPGSPIQAWCFFFGFLLFPIWWIAGLFLRVPTTRIAGDVDAEKGVAIDDPQIEHDARTWRLRCRVMAVLSLFTYIPFIILVAIFTPR